jgi:murein DD-endopeptidase MepM/ murein hydrolase activator NlpD
LQEHVRIARRLQRKTIPQFQFDTDGIFFIPSHLAPILKGRSLFGLLREKGRVNPKRTPHFWVRHLAKNFQWTKLTFSKKSNNYMTPHGDSVRISDGLEISFTEPVSRYYETPVYAGLKRISDRFNPKRKHPKLGITRAHKGKDYAAPYGTPIRSSAKGRIIFVGRKGGFGKHIIVKHSNGSQTSYSHNSRYAKGMKRGKWVEQGQVIGYVGSTGVATGPHLHYEVKINGKQVDPDKYNPKIKPSVLLASY